MDTKNTIVSGLAGSFIYFLLGWIFYGVLFTDIYPPNENMNLSFIYFGGLINALLVAAIFVHWAKVTSIIRGILVGGFIGFMNALSMNLFMYSGKELMMRNMAMDIIITTVITAVMGAVIAIVISKMSNTTTK